MRILWVLISLITHSSVFAATDTYKLASAIALQNCFEKQKIAHWNDAYLGPSDANGKCVKDSTKNCWPFQQFAAIPKANYMLTQTVPPTTKTLCEEMEEDNCELLVISVERTPADPIDHFRFVRASMRKGAVVSAQSGRVPVNKIVNLESRFVISVNACDMYEARFRISPVK